MVDTGSSYLAVSHIGDIVEFMPSSLSLSTSIHKLYSASNDTYRVDDFAWSDAKDTLVVGYLGPRQGKLLEKPPHQVILYKREPAAVRLSSSAHSRVRRERTDRPRAHRAVRAWWRGKSTCVRIKPAESLLWPPFLALVAFVS